MSSGVELDGKTIEKPWIGAVESFAIGGGCQYLLVTDYIVAEKGSYLTLPARKEGIIPGVANMRLPRFVGDRIARQAIQYERKIECDSEVGKLICDEIVNSCKDQDTDDMIYGSIDESHKSKHSNIRYNIRSSKVIFLEDAWINAMLFGYLQAANALYDGINGVIAFFIRGGLWED